jgi:DNA-binding transcriptional regulator YhcF (GntR family)
MLYLIDLKLSNIEKCPSLMDIQWETRVGKCSVNRAFFELTEEGWLEKVNGASRRVEYYKIIIDKEFANNFMRAWLDLYHLSKKSTRYNKLLSHVINWEDKRKTKCS